MFQLFLVANWSRLKSGRASRCEGARKSLDYRHISVCRAWPPDRRQSLVRVRFDRQGLSRFPSGVRGRADETGRNFCLPPQTHRRGGRLATAGSSQKQPSRILDWSGLGTTCRRAFLPVSRLELNRCFQRPVPPLRGARCQVIQCMSETLEF